MFLIWGAARRARRGVTATHFEALVVPPSIRPYNIGLVFFFLFWYGLVFCFLCFLAACPLFTKRLCPPLASLDLDSSGAGSIFW